MKDEVRPLVWVSALHFLQCFDNVGWLTGRTSGPYKEPVSLIMAAVVSLYLSSSYVFFPRLNLSGRTLHVYHTSTHGLALVWI